MDYVQVLPDEIWLRIFAFVDGKKLLNTLALVCGHFHGLIEDEELWEAQVRRVVKARPDPIVVPAPPPSQDPPAPPPPAGSDDQSASKGEAICTAFTRMEVGSNPASWDPAARKHEAKKRKIAENKRTFREMAEGWLKPKDRTWKWLYQAKTNEFKELADPVTGAGVTGIGWHQWTDESLYEGEWVAGQGTGVGTRWEPGWKCIGGFIEDSVNGEASAFWAGPWVIYDGAWKDGRPHGYGMKCHPKDGRYEGIWVDGLEEGHGKHTWNDDSYYEGEWAEGQQNGHGTYMWKSGNFFTGLWKSCNQVKGVNTWFDGRAYDGDYEAGQKHGQGTYYWPDGTVYKGGWKNGLREGEGRMDWPDGTFFFGEWHGDDQVEVKETNVQDWAKRNKPYDLYFREDGEVWNRKYMADIKERRRLKKLAMEEEKLKKKLAKGSAGPSEELPHA